MKTLVFLRHGHSAANAKNLLTGRLSGVGLSQEGKKQADALVERIGRQIDFVHVSPIERCQLTIEPWLNSRYSSSLKKLEIDDRLSEIDFGDWSGKSLTTLKRNPLWKKVQRQPASFTFPGGESFRRAQNRALSLVDEILNSRGENVHLLVTHADVIKLISAHLMKIKLNDFQGIQISPASFSIFMGSRDSSSMMTLNNRGALSEWIK